MPYVDPTDRDRGFLRLAFEEARQGYAEGGVAVGAVLVRDGEVVARGRNRLVQESNPILHGETDCIRNAGRGVDFGQTTLYTSLSPCAMCAGAILLFGIPRVVIGDNESFPGEIDWLLRHDVESALANDREMIDFFARFRRERPDLWDEDIKGYVERPGAQT